MFALAATITNYFGIAPSNQFSEKAAVLGFLILQQIYYHTPHFKDYSTVLSMMNNKQMANLTQTQPIVLTATRLQSSDPHSQLMSLGTRLMALRQKAIAEGIELLSTEEILAEVKHRRGEV